MDPKAQAFLNYLKYIIGTVNYKVNFLHMLKCNVAFVLQPLPITEWRIEYLRCGSIFSIPPHHLVLLHK